MIMGEFNYILVKLFLLSSAIIYQCDGSSDTYTAAVIGMKAERYHLATPEFAFYYNIDHCATLVSYLMLNSTVPPDIIVFPEKGLQGDNEPYPVTLPPTEDYAVPCILGSRYNMGLRSLSCLAREKKIYMVVNLVEKHYNVSSGRTMRFNTDVVFNRDGAVIETYRKSNLNETGFDLPGKPDLAYFLADFGVNFGVITGTDLLFKEPAKTLLYTLGVSHIIHPTKWFNELPFLTALEMQSSWAYKTNTVLLSAGYNDPEQGYGGSGIYQGQLGALEYMQPESNKVFALVSLVPKNVNSPINQGVQSNAKGALPFKTFVMSLDKVYSQPSLLMEMSVDVMEEKIWTRHSPSRQRSAKYVHKKSILKVKSEDVQSYTTKLIEPSFDVNNNTIAVNATADSKPKLVTATANVMETICSNKNKFCCKFQIQMVTNYVVNTTKMENVISGDNFTNYYYRLAVFDGFENFTNGDTWKRGGVQICGLVPCLNKTVDSCALRTDNHEVHPPTVAPPATIAKYGQTYVLVGTTFNFINITSEIKNLDSDTYPIILHKARNNEEFGSVPNYSRYLYSSQYMNTSKSQINNLQTKYKVDNLGSIGLFTRIYDRSSSDVIALIKPLLILPVILVNRLIL